MQSEQNNEKIVEKGRGEKEIGKDLSNCYFFHQSNQSIFCILRIVTRSLSYLITMHIPSTSYI